MKNEEHLRQEMEFLRKQLAVLEARRREIEKLLMHYKKEGLA
jgi:hypothetical protein